MAPQETPDPDWQAMLEGDDRDAFEALVRPYVDDLFRSARHDLEYYVAQGHLRERDFTPEEVTGEALIQAWQRRRQRPETMSLRGWLLGTQYRALRGLVERQKAYRHNKALSLDAPVPPGGPEGFDTQEWFYEWRQPFSQLVWEDVIPGEEPVDLEIPLERGQVRSLPNPDAYHVLMLHDAFEVPLPEVAFTMERAPNEVAEELGQARANLRERMIEDPPPEADDVPAPPEGSDE